jgi:hypothetical protein
MKLSPRVKQAIENEIAEARKSESKGQVPLFGSSWWSDVLTRPAQYQALIADLEKHYSQSEERS